MNYYEILKVSKDASLEDIKSAKDKLKFGSSEERVPFSMWESIDEAYNVLSNEDSRKAYDLELDNIDSTKIESFNQNTIEDEPAIINENFTDNLDKNINDETFNGYDSQDKFSVESYYSNENIIGNANNKETIDELNVKNIFKDIPEENFNITNSETNSYNNIIIKNNEDEDIKYFKSYAKNIEVEIDKLIQKSHNNSRLDLLKLRYINQIDMIEKILEMRKNFVNGDSNPITLSLENALNLIKERLPIINDKIDKYNREHEISYLIEQI